jgi:hypothetical protein
MSFRALCFVAGCVLLGLTVNATVAASGGYEVPQNLVLVGIAGGLAIGAIAVGRAWAVGQRAIAIGLVLALFAGEVLVLIMTAERVAVAQDAAQAPLRDAKKRRNEVAKRVGNSQRKLASIKGSSERLKAALTAQSKASAAITENAAARSCARNCRILLEAKLGSASAEVAAARAEMERRRERARKEWEAAVASLEALPVDRSATPLADRLNVDQFTIDIAKAFATSMAANGLACFLIALAGHGGGKAPTSPAAPVPLARNDKPPRSAAVQTTKFLEAVPAPVPVELFVDRAIIAKSGSIRVVEIYAAYKDWCSQTNSLAIDEAGFVQEFAALAIDRNMESSNPQDPRIHGIGFKKTMKAA